MEPDRSALEKDYCPQCELLPLCTLLSWFFVSKPPPSSSVLTEVSEPCASMTSLLNDVLSLRAFSKGEAERMSTSTGVVVEPPLQSPGYEYPATARLAGRAQSLCF
ncbi:hypothetical protein Baya_10281 [Bagarius yarrelli]|uniref:Uncharacterized protein n=1 Tax=Bagarius yarrelli TaxID=175774 RepID=A0A556UY20_BAGYA|nr:hypothetical protein Baya_10281 [Bagarius yarrelli]